MAIRLRKVDNILIALCAAETDEVDGDIYLDDNTHYALSMKFARDWEVSGQCADHNALAETQKLRDAKETLIKWLTKAGSTPKNNIKE